MTEKSRIILPGSMATNPTIDQIGQTFEDMHFAKEREVEGIISQRVHVPPDKIELALAFWKPLYLDTTIEGRHLNGVEAHDMGNETKYETPNKVPFIAMCNIMALEALLRMGDDMPTVEHPTNMVFGTQREIEIADFWKRTFAPILLQAEWAWCAALAVMAGDPVATSELLENFKDQLP